MPRNGAPKPHSNDGVDDILEYDATSQQYLVLWEQSNHPTWVPAADLVGCAHSVIAFHQFDFCELPVCLREAARAVAMTMPEAPSVIQDHANTPEDYQQRCAGQLLMEAAIEAEANNFAATVRDPTRTPSQRFLDLHHELSNALSKLHDLAGSKHMFTSPSTIANISGLLDPPVTTVCADVVCELSGIRRRWRPYVTLLDPKIYTRLLQDMVPFDAAELDRGVGNIFDQAVAMPCFVQPLVGTIGHWTLLYIRTPLAKTAATLEVTLWDSMKGKPSDAHRKALSGLLTYARPHLTHNPAKIKIVIKQVLSKPTQPNPADYSCGWWMLAFIRGVVHDQWNTEHMDTIDGANYMRLAMAMEHLLLGSNVEQANAVQDFITGLIWPNVALMDDTASAVGSAHDPADLPALSGKGATVSAAGAALVPADVAALSEEPVTASAAGSGQVPADVPALALMDDAASAAGSVQAPADLPALSGTGATVSAAGSVQAPADVAALSGTGVPASAAGSVQGTRYFSKEVRLAVEYCNLAVGYCILAAGFCNLDVD